MDSCEGTKENIHRMYTEVRYTEASSGMGDLNNVLISIMYWQH